MPLAVSRLDGRGFRLRIGILPRGYAFPRDSFTDSPAPIFLGSAIHHADLRRCSEPLGCDDRLDGALSARGAGCATCGDVNPDRRTARLSAAFASGGHISSQRFLTFAKTRCAQTHLAVPSLAADLRRTRVQTLASHGVDRTYFSGAFSFFAGHFHARRRREIYPASLNLLNEFTKTATIYPPFRVIIRRTNSCAVENSVEKLIRERQTAMRSDFFLDS